MVGHTNARVPMPANVNGRIVSLRSSAVGRFATVDFRQGSITVAVIAGHVIRRTYAV